MDQSFKSGMQRYANHLPNAKLIVSAYERILHRTPHPGEVVHWDAVISSGFEGDAISTFERRSGKLGRLLRRFFPSSKAALFIETKLSSSDECRQLLRNQNRVSVDFQTFKLYASEDDLAIGHSIIHNKTYEPHVSRIIRETLRAGDVFLDLGANIGYFTLLAASIVGESGKVISFEPNMYNLQLLYSSIVDNGFKNVMVFPLGVSDARRIMRFITVGSNGGLDVPTAHQENLQLIQLARVDEILQHEARINVVKMDIEGYEPFALRGMVDLIKRHRPIVLTEFHPWAISCCGNEPEHYLKQLIECGQRLSIIGTKGDVVDAPDTDYIMKFWQGLGDKTAHIDLMARPA